MSEFLFIHTPSANGEPTRVRINDVPRLFSEGLEEAPAPAPFPWQSLWQKLATSFAAEIGQVNLKSQSDYMRAKYDLDPVEDEEDAGADVAPYRRFKQAI